MATAAAAAVEAVEVVAVAAKVVEEERAVEEVAMDWVTEMALVARVAAARGLVAAVREAKEEEEDHEVE